jgi:hypothetical protein
LIVPPVEVIPYATLAKAKQFFDGGGVVIAHGFLPSRSATLGKTSADIAALREAIWGRAAPSLAACKRSPAGGRSYLLPERPSPEDLQRVLAEDAGLRPALEVLKGETSHWLHVLHCVKAGCDVFFVCNQNHEGPARGFRFRVTAPGVPECWDAMRGEITAVPFQQSGKGMAFDLTLQPLETVLLVFQPHARDLPPRQGPGSSPARATFALVRDRSIRDAVPAVPAADGRPLTLSPVKADIFHGRVELPADVDLARSRVYLELDVLVPEAAAAVTVNGHAAGGFIGRPFRLDLTRWLKPGVNTVDIAPFAPKSARLLIYDRARRE